MKEKIATVKIALNNKVVEEFKPLCLLVTFNRQPRVYSFGRDCFLSKKEFENKNLKKTKKAIEAIEPYYIKAQKIIKDLGRDFTFHEFKKRLNGDALPKVIKLDLESIYKEYCNEMKKGESTTQNYMSACHSFVKFQHDLTINDITPEFMYKYEKTQNSQTTVGIYARSLRAVYNYAVAKKYIVDNNPFGKYGYSIPVTLNPKQALDAEFLHKILCYETDNENLRFSLDMFIFSFLENGMNVADMICLKNKNIVNNEVLVWRRLKTTKTKVIPQQLTAIIIPRCRDIMEKYGCVDFNKPESYIFPFIHDDLSERQKLERKRSLIKRINKGLKIIAEELEIPCFKTYAARHSFATQSFGHGRTIEEIKEFLGHSTTKVTEAYIRSLGCNIDNQKQLINSLANL